MSKEIYGVKDAALSNMFSIASTSTTNLAAEDPDFKKFADLDLSAGMMGITAPSTPQR
jgi:hypothetical protein